jgi:hypothetical protein
MPNNAIAVTEPLRVPKANYAYRYPAALRVTPDEPELPYFLDCATAKLDLCISSWCGCNCGLSFSPEIRGLGLPTGNGLVDVARARHGEPVWKVGRATGRTRGVVSDVAGATPPDPVLGAASGILVVAFEAADESDVTQFTDAGDSGAAIVNADGKLVGLHFAGANLPGGAADPLHSNNSHIHPVLAALNVAAITRAHPVRHSDNAAAVDLSAAASIDLQPDDTVPLRDKLLASEEGRRLEALFRAHREEVVRLVNHNRRVTVAWQRGQGPAYLNRVARSARARDASVPRQIGGVTRAELLEGLARALVEHGSPALAADVERHREATLRCAERFDRLHDLVDHLVEGERA